MALILFDDFAGYTLSQITRVWTSYSSPGVSITSSGGRFGTDPYITFTENSGQGYIQKSFAATSTLVVGFAFKITAPVISGSQAICVLYNGSTEQCRLIVTADHKPRVQRGGTDVTGGVSTNAFSQGVWYYVEWKVTVSNSISANTCQLNVDETNWIDVTAGEDLQNDTTSDISMMRIGTIFGSNTGTFQYGHVYIDNGTSFYGDSRVETLTVTGNGTTQNFTSSGGSHSPDVDDATPDDDSTYVESSNVGDIETFQMSNLSASPSTIHALAVWNCIRKTDGGNRTAAAVVRSGTTNYVQANLAVSDGYFYHPTILTQDPDTASAWSVSGVNAHEAGLKVIA